MLLKIIGAKELALDWIYRATHAAGRRLEAPMRWWRTGAALPRWLPMPAWTGWTSYRPKSEFVVERLAVGDWPSADSEA